MNKPVICAVIINNDIPAIKKVEELVNIFEVRIDLIGNEWQKLVKQLDKPWIATNRAKDEGGKWQDDEDSRIEELLRAIELGADMVDIELQTNNLAQIIPLVKPKVKCILSYHNFHNTSTLVEMKDIVHQQIDAGADICKVVSTAREMKDNITVLRLITEFSENRLVAFSMGQKGQISRILCPLVGSYFTYASISQGKESAPGQVKVEEMLTIYEILKVQ